MSQYQSYKWISSDSNHAIKVDSDVQTRVFGPVAKSPCNLISIFGRARQGKSFLMNCLAGEKEIFRISNEKESCTQGIDISNKWLELSEFGRIDSARSATTSGSSARIKVGFVDAEGQGDKDVSYDANLICPILLASKCVIFNWKGDLQKDHLLSTLGIMARAAHNISTDGSSSTGSSSTFRGGGGSSSGRGCSRAKFGHLHIVFRDWQAVGSDDQSVSSALLDVEGTPEAASRDQIRADLLSSFASIRVWLFDAPSEYVRDLRQKLTFEKTSQTFRAQLRSLRAALSAQLQEPTYVAGTRSVLTGRAFGPLTAQIADALNRGQVVLPSSAYLSMLRDEAAQLQRQYEQDLRQQMQALLQKVGRTTASSRGALYASEAEVKHEWKQLLSHLQASYQDKLTDTFGDVISGIAADLISGLNEQVGRINADMEQQFLALYKQGFTQWLMEARRRVESNLEGAVHDMLQQINNSGSFSGERATSAADEWPMPAEQLNGLLNNLWGRAVAGVGGEHGYPGSSEAADARAVLRRHFDALADRVIKANGDLLQQSFGKARQFLQDAQAEIEQSLHTSVEQLRAQHSHGFPMGQLEVSLNEKYHELHGMLQQQLQKSPCFAVHGQGIIKEFSDFCFALCGEMRTLYEKVKKQALQQQTEQLQQRFLQGPLQALRQQLEEQSNPLYREDAEELLPVMLPPLLEGSVQSAVRAVEGWLVSCNEVAMTNLQRGRVPEDEKQALQVVLQQEEAFVAELREIADQCISAFQQELLEYLPERPAEEEEEEEEDEEEEDEEEEEEEDGEEEEGDTFPARKAKPLKAGLSLAEQKARAREWACQNMGMKQVGKNKRMVSTAPKRSSSSGAASAGGIKVRKVGRGGGGATAGAEKPKKSLAQQRQDALDFAVKQFGADIAYSPPPADKGFHRASLGDRGSSRHSLDSARSVGDDREGEFASAGSGAGAGAGASRRNRDGKGKRRPSAGSNSTTTSSSGSKRKADERFGSDNEDDGNYEQPVQRPFRASFGTSSLSGDHPSYNTTAAAAAAATATAAGDREGSGGRGSGERAAATASVSERLSAVGATFMKWFSPPKAEEEEEEEAEKMEVSSEGDDDGGDNGGDDHGLDEGRGKGETRVKQEKSGGSARKTSAGVRKGSATAEKDNQSSSRSTSRAKVPAPAHISASASVPPRGNTSTSTSSRNSTSSSNSSSRAGGASRGTALKDEAQQPQQTGKKLSAVEAAKADARRRQEERANAAAEALLARKQRAKATKGSK